MTPRCNDCLHKREPDCPDFVWTCTRAGRELAISDAPRPDWCPGFEARPRDPNAHVVRIVLSPQARESLDSYLDGHVRLKSQRTGKVAQVVTLVHRGVPVRTNRFVEPGSIWVEWSDGYTERIGARKETSS